ncbi:PACE efflux transporter [Providencia sp. Me31A]|uniref:PACE efflux transporter n=1 Tax=Providencia sp. Me31A TaxID=3392637 RepID=UPI003D2C561B
MVLAPRRRKLIYAVVFEFFAILLSALLLFILNNENSPASLPVAIAVSVIALIWNYFFNTVFEYLELSFGVVKRTFKVRVLHSAGFEIGLFIFTVPLYMWWYDVSFFKALSMEVTILVFFFIYTYVFTYIFDLLFPRVN